MWSADNDTVVIEGQHERMVQESRRALKQLLMQDTSKPKQLARHEPRTVPRSNGVRHVSETREMERVKAVP